MFKVAELMILPYSSRQPRCFQPSGNMMYSIKFTIFSMRSKPSPKSHGPLLYLGRALFGDFVCGPFVRHAENLCRKNESLTGALFIALDSFHAALSLCSVIIRTVHGYNILPGQYDQARIIPTLEALQVNGHP